MIDHAKLRLAAYAVAAVLLAVAGTRYLNERSAGAGGGAAPIALDGTKGSERPKSGRKSVRRIFVHVAGAVRRPGLFRVPAGSRTAAAIARAGGLSTKADLALINLAAPLQDGQQVLVPEAGTVAAAAPAGASGTSGTTGSPGGGSVVPLSLSSATPEQLDALDGIGPTLSERIIEYREANGGFRSLEELREVDGIGEKRFESLSQAVRP